MVHTTKAKGRTITLKGQGTKCSSLYSSQLSLISWSVKKWPDYKGKLYVHDVVIKDSLQTGSPRPHIVEYFEALRKDKNCANHFIFICLPFSDPALQI